MKVSPCVSVSRKRLLDLAEDAAAARSRALAAGLDITHVERRHLDDGADVQPVLLGDARIGYAPQPVLVQADAGIALVVLQRIAAGGDEIDDPIECRPIEIGIGRGRSHFLEQRIGMKRRAAGAAQHMLRQHVERAIDQRRRVLGAEIVGVERRPAFQHLEAIGRDQDRLRRLVHAVIGAADALRQPARTLRRADMHDQVDVAPVDAEIERRGGDDGAQLHSRPSPSRRAGAGPHRASRDAARSARCPR